MTIRGLGWTATLALSVAVGAPALAQERQQPEEEDATLRVGRMPDWSIKTEVDRLDSSMREYTSLINSLGKASEDLGEEFQRYLKNPNDQVLASSVERKMAIYARTVMADFDDIIADQDLLGTNFRELKRKLTAFSGHLNNQSRGYKLQLDSYTDNARKLEQELVTMSIEIRENPPGDPDELRAMKRKFAKQFRRYRLQARYVNGYRRQYKNYQDLSKNMGTLAGMFTNLHDKFGELIENLENERKYLDDSIRLQADKIRIQQIIREGVLGSEVAIGNVAEKLANLYNKVDAFARVHERINGDLSNFIQSQGALVDVTRKIDAIGTQGGGIGDLATDMDKAIDAFYRLRNEPDGEDALILDEVQREVKDREAAREAAEAPAPPPAPAPAPAPAPREPAPAPSPQPAPAPQPAGGE